MSGKFSSLTQRRKKLVDKYILEVLSKSHEYDYGEFGSSLWSALLLEYFREDKDNQVGIESIMHWCMHTSWGRRIKRAYEIGIQSIKEGADPVRQFEVAKGDAFRKRSPCSSADENNYKQRGRRRKSQQYSEPDPHAVIGMMHDHDYSRNPWLEPFGETVVIDMGSIGGEVEV